MNKKQMVREAAALLSAAIGCSIADVQLVLTEGTRTLRDAGWVTSVVHYSLINGPLRQLESLLQDTCSDASVCDEQYD